MTKPIAPYKPMPKRILQTDTFETVDIRSCVAQRRTNCTIVEDASPIMKKLKDQHIRSTLPLVALKGRGVPKRGVEIKGVTYVRNHGWVCQIYPHPTDCDNSCDEILVCIPGIL